MAATPVQLFTNNAQSQLAGDITSIATTAALLSGAGALFPNPGANQYFLLTFVDAATGLQNEIVKVTAMAGDTITTMVRGQEGTAAQAWAAGDVAALFATAGTLHNLAQPPDLQKQAGNYAVDAGSANVLVVTLAPVPVNLAGIRGTDIRVTKSAADNTGAATINVNGFGDTPIVRLNGDPLSAGDLPASSTFTIIYDGTHFVLQSATSGAVSSGRAILTSNQSFFVSTAGNDSNDGLSLGTPWLTLQHAWNVISDGYDLAGFNATVQIANGTYAAGVNAGGQLVGATTAASLTFQSGTGTASACLINTAGACFQATEEASYTLHNLTMVSGSNSISCSNGAQINVGAGVIFGAAGGGQSHIFCWNAARVVCTDNYTITGSAQSHMNAQRNGVIYFHDSTVTLTGTPAFTSFAMAGSGAVLFAQSMTYTGGATGARYAGELNAVINTGGGGANYFPGNSAGAVATGAQYA